jgi:flagellar motor switch protein FliG
MASAAAAASEAERPEELTGLQKAAILVMYLDREVAKTVLRQLTNEEVKQLGLAISTVQMVPEATIEAIVCEFVGALQEVNLLPVSGMEFAREVLPDLVDDARREVIAGAIRRRVGSDFEDFIKGRPAIAIAGVLAEEHPQVRAVALLRMGPENAARVMSVMDDDLQFDLTMRMAKAERVSGELADDVERSVRRALEDQDDSLLMGGAQTTARILGRLPRERNTVMLARMRAESADLAQAIQQLMVTFEDLDALDDRGIQALLRTVDRNDLVVALKAAKPQLRDRFLKNLSTRAAADLSEEMEILGNPRKSEIKRAQEAITSLAQRLSDEGVITLVPAGGDE